MAADDGIVLRLPDDGSLDSLPALSELIRVDPDEVTARLTTLIGGSACSPRGSASVPGVALPRRDPRRRSPLWQQRQRSAQLLSVASGMPISPSCSRRCGSACRMSTTCLGSPTCCAPSIPGTSGSPRSTRRHRPLRPFPCSSATWRPSCTRGFTARRAQVGRAGARRRPAHRTPGNGGPPRTAPPRRDGRRRGATGQRLGDRAAATTEQAWDVLREIGPLRRDEGEARGVGYPRWRSWSTPVAPSS